jgi:hypothetical protein
MGPMNGSRACLNVPSGYYFEYLTDGKEATTTTGQCILYERTPRFRKVKLSWRCPRCDSGKMRHLNGPNAKLAEFSLKLVCGQSA